MHAWPLYLIGVVAEFSGVVCLGFPDLLPDALRLSRWLGRQGRRAANTLRRLVGRPQRGDVHVGAAAGAITLTGGSIEAIVSTGATTIEEKVEYLLRRDHDAQRHVNALGERVSRLEAESPRALKEAQRGMEEHVASELAAAQDEYRPLRVVGTVLLVVGLVCTTVATFVG
jgi:hypothetical protein